MISVFNQRTLIIEKMTEQVGVALPRLFLFPARLNTPLLTWWNGNDARIFDLKTPVHILKELTCTLDFSVAGGVVKYTTVNKPHKTSGSNNEQLQVIS